MRQSKIKPLSNSQRKKHLGVYNQLFPTSVKIYSTFSKKFTRYAIVPREQMDWEKWNDHGYPAGDGYFNPECTRCCGFASTYGHVPDPETEFGYKLGYIPCPQCEGSGWGKFVVPRK